MACGEWRSQNAKATRSATPTTTGATTRLYGHVLPGDQRAAAERVVRDVLLPPRAESPGSSRDGKR